MLQRIYVFTLKNDSTQTIDYNETNSDFPIKHSILFIHGSNDKKNENLILNFT